MTCCFSRRGATVRVLPVLVLVAVVLVWPSAAIAIASEGMASYYGTRFHGRRTASGQRFDQHALTAAHRTLQFGTRVRVTHKGTGRSVVVTINDRGPYARGRIIDLSKRAAERLGMLRSGVAPVRIEVLGGRSASQRRTSNGQGSENVDTIWALFGA
jgi:rare lipoprotein A